MKRYRVTLFVICMVLIVLGIADLRVYLRNPEPLIMSLQEVSKADKLSQEWLTITGGTLLIDEAVNPSGDEEIKALLIPYVPDASEDNCHVFVESSNETWLNLFKKYHFSFNSKEEKQAFLDENLDRFRPQIDLSGMVVVGLFVEGNRDKMLELADISGMNVSDNVIFFRDSNKPGKPFGAAFFLVMAFLGLSKLIYQIVKQNKEGQPPSVEV